MRNTLHILLISLVVIGLLGLCWFIGSRSTPNVPTSEAPQPAKGFSAGRRAAQDDFVGSEACTRCHPGICEQFSAHPMARSTRRISEDDWAHAHQNLPAVVSGERRSLVARLRGDQMVHAERMHDAEGELIYEQNFPMDYVVGSGQRARAYIYRRGQAMFMSPLNWYRSAQDWDLAPGYHPDDIRRFDRRVTESCLNCHSGRVAVEPDGTDLYQSPAFYEVGIGCERCHGPGKSHVAFHDGRASHLHEDPIVNPIDLPMERRDAVCYQCHLEAPARILRTGKTHTSFRPGMHLTEVWAILDQGIRVDQQGRTRSVNHVQQMRASKCFQASGGEMGCVSCHDPHRVPAAEERLSFYQQKCLECHAEQPCSESLNRREQFEDDCIACHMPSLESSNMAHVAQTDHRVLRQPQAAPAPTNEQVESLELFADARDHLNADQRQRAIALGTYVHCRTQGIPLPAGLIAFLEEAQTNFPQDAMLNNVLGAISHEQGNLSAARRYFSQSHEVAPWDEEALDGLLGVAYSQRRWSEALTYADQLLEILPGSVRVHAIRGDALVQLGQRQAGLEAVERAREFNPGAEPLYEWLIEQYAALRQDRKVEELTRQLERIRDAKPSTDVKDED